MRIFENINYDFIGARTRGYLFSGTLLVISIVSLVTVGVGLGIDFLGGTEFIVRTAEPLNVADVRGSLSESLNAPTEVKTFGSPEELLIRVSSGGDIDQLQADVLNALSTTYPGSSPEMEGTNSVGPRFAADLKRGAILAVIFSLIVIFLYILVRFEWSFGVGAVAALAHDVTITLGIFSLLRFIAPFSVDIDQAIIAAFLTIVGYSLNDTVVVFDRIREYASLFKADEYVSVVNRSINSTLSRTVVTSLTTLFVVVVLFLFGGETLRGFAFALIVGILIGTYSSVFVAAPVVVELRNRFGGRR